MAVAPDRRRFLRLAALTAAGIGLAACSTPDHLTAAPTGAATLTCADPTPGTLSNPSGSVNSTPATDLVDIFSNKDPVRFQYQWWAMASNIGPSHAKWLGGACSRFRKYQRVPGEVTVSLVLLGSRPTGDYGVVQAPPTPLTLDVLAATNTEVPAGSGNLFVARAFTDRYGTNCSASSEDPTAGSITFTTLTDPYTFDPNDPNVGAPPTSEGAGLVEATFDLSFGADRIQGTVSAPFCSMAGCPARPSKAVCVK